MTFAKTELGLQALKDRHAAAITQRQRSLLIIVDGKRSVDEALRATAGLGTTKDDVKALVEGGLIHDVRAESPPADDLPPKAAEAASAAASQSDASATGLAAIGDSEERRRRYQAAYPMATQLTAQLGLRGFRLNLAVEAAEGYEGLVGLLPKIRAAVGDERVKPLHQALLG